MSAAAQADASTSPARPAASLKSSSWRRRQQQLRSSQRFVVKSIQMARAASTHHTGHGSTQSSDNGCAVAEIVALRAELRCLRAHVSGLQLQVDASAANEVASRCTSVSFHHDETSDL